MYKDSDIHVRTERLYSEGSSLLALDECFIDLGESPPPQSTWSYKIQAFLWDTIDRPVLERKFLVKLDTFLLSSACLGYFIKTLNQSNIGTAYVNGMKEYYGMQGNDYNKLISLWTVGYVIGQVPSQLLLHRVNASCYFCILELTWALLTMCCVFVRDIKSLYLLRFLIGVTESGYFPGMEYLLGCWYSKGELTKRSTLFSCSGSLAGLISGPLQQLILKMDWSGSSLVPFQWMFCIDCFLSIPVALYTYFMIPDTPSTTEVFYFDKLDKLVGMERRRLSGAQLEKEPLSWSKLKTFFREQWYIYVFPLLFLCFNNSGELMTAQAFQLWMKIDLELDSSYYNMYPSVISALSIILALIVAKLNDWGQLHALFLSTMFLCTVISGVILSIWQVPLKLHWMAYYLFGMTHSIGQPVIFSWINGILAHDDLQRNFVIVVTNTSAYFTSVWVPMLTFNQRDAPNFHVGFLYTTLLGICGLFLVATVVFKLNQSLRTYHRS